MVTQYLLADFTYPWRLFGMFPMMVDQIVQENREELVFSHSVHSAHALAGATPAELSSKINRFKFARTRHSLC